MEGCRKRGCGYLSDVTEEKWEFVLPYLVLCREDSPHCRHDLRPGVQKSLRYATRTEAVAYLSREYGPWWAVHPQRRRWLEAGVFEALRNDMQLIVREWAGRQGQPTPESDAPRWLPWSQAAGEIKGSHRGGHPGSSARAQTDGCRWGDREQVPALTAETQRSPTPAWNWLTSTRAIPDQRRRSSQRAWCPA